MHPDRPTHFIFVRGEDQPHVVFPEGYRPSELRELPADYWEGGPKRWEGSRKAGGFVADLAPERERQWRKAKRRRAAEIAESCETPLGPVDTTPAAIAAINDAWGHALADPEGFSREWTMADNSVAPVDFEAMRQIKIAVSEHIEAAHRRAAKFRAAVINATTIAGIRAVRS